MVIERDYFRTRKDRLGPMLDCGHRAHPREWMRYGPERWCLTCCCWRELVRG